MHDMNLTREQTDYGHVCISRTRIGMGQTSNGSNMNMVTNEMQNIFLISIKT